VRLFRERLPQERPAVPPTGYKVAFPMLSWDGTRTGFRGVSLGGRIVYGALDEARCGYGRRHDSPARGCDCGVYCLHSAAEAQALTCATDCRDAVILQVSVLGAYTRYERGVRYARQRVRNVRVGACRCGRAAEAFVRTETGLPGWRELRGTCVACAGGLRLLELREFAGLAGAWVNVTTSVGGRVLTQGAQGAQGAEAGLPALAAEAALLRARLDEFQERLAELEGDPEGGPWAAG
jgi:hypothetical protein